MTNFAFIDVNTQKCFIEHFGARAIEGAVNIRENLMHLSALALEKRIPVLSPVFEDSDSCAIDSNDWQKTMDSCLSDQVFYTDGVVMERQQYLFKHQNLENPAIIEIKNICQQLDVEVVYIYGCPLESSVSRLALALNENMKVWIVKDCVVGSSEAQSVLKSLREKGIKSLTTRTLDKFLRDDC